MEKNHKEEAIAAQKHELKRLENHRDLQVMAAKLKAYSEADSGEACDKSRTAGSEVASCPPALYKEIQREQTNNTNNVSSLV